jgi:hypothetical protein
MSKNRLFLVIVILAPLIMAFTGCDVKISWNLPTSHADGTPIDPTDVQTITVRIYSGPTKTGPWKLVATSSPGATSVTVPGPAAGQTLWYTATSTLREVESDYAVPASKANFAVFSSPVLNKVLEKMITPRKMIAISCLVLLIALGWLICRHPD